MSNYKVLNISIYVVNNDDEKPIRLASSMNENEFSWNMFSIMYSSKIYEIINFSTRLAVKCTPLENEPYRKQTIKLDDLDFVAHTLVHKHEHVNYGCVMITDSEYPKQAAYAALHEIMSKYCKYEHLDIIFNDDKTNDDLHIEWLDDMLNKCKDPSFDKISQVQGQLDEVIEIMTQNIQLLLKRGETLENLLKNTTELSEDCKKFTQRSKQLNRWCPQCILL